MKGKVLKVISLVIVAALLFTACVTDKSDKYVDDLKDEQEADLAEEPDKKTPAEEANPYEESQDINGADDSASKDEKAKKEENPAQGTEGIDIDLTKLSKTMAYSQVVNILMEAEKYEGKTIRIRGALAVAKSNDGSQYYTGVIVSDAGACCQQGLEFLWPDHTYPGDFPEEGSQLTVTGVLKNYEEDGHTYWRLVADEVIFD